jgi:DNA-directed RNA polymerase specialized sigma24 family protein
MINEIFANLSPDSCTLWMTGRLKESSMRAELGSFEEWSYRLQEFVQPVFGFALNRTGNRQEAEDLAQEIMLQCEKSLAGGAVVQNLESYVWSIARYSWMKSLNGRARASVELNGMPEWADDADTNRWSKCWRTMPIVCCAAKLPICPDSNAKSSSSITTITVSSPRSPKP